MATKTIKATVTLHIPGPHFVPFKFSEAGIATEGKYDIVEAAPGTPVALDADEADRLIAIGLAELYHAPNATSAPAAIEEPASSAPQKSK